MVSPRVKRRELLIAEVARHFLALKSGQKADLIVAVPDLYFAVARLARHEEASP